MKKLFIAAFFILSQISGFTQDLEDINDLLGKNKYQEAKDAIDKYLQNHKKEKDAEAWYFKGRIYNSLSQQENMDLSQSYNLKVESYLAFKKNQSIDTKDIRMIFEGHNSYLNLYSGFYDLGSAFFNEKKYNDAVSFHNQWDSNVEKYDSWLIEIVGGFYLKNNVYSIEIAWNRTHIHAKRKYKYSFALKKWL